ncbi:hypothetical protein KFK14_02625 [Sphingobium phenoxybenzoativorans]|uniref:Uncharacterized protein n=1 Tax=Sphingobium phenoxybenzoativorans TaxID=1592790 RepID=A0A975K8F3_9SPHN|nr:hypothetical protein [Sphingobium phenoxybenzoativorans]QUT06392.1 hypothetical protein KFK14_02625 [Sphingobium phenoxybenzoativorans]
MTLIRPSELFERVRAFWPAKISTSSNAVNDIYWPLEERFGDDEWLQVGGWSFHQAVSCLAREAAERGEQALLISAITVEDFDGRMRSNLSHDDWVNERPLYGNLSTRADGN